MANSLDRHPLQRSDPQFCQTLVASLFGDRLNAIGSDVLNATFGWLHSWSEIMLTSAMPQSPLAFRTGSGRAAFSLTVSVFPRLSPRHHRVETHSGSEHRSPLPCSLPAIAQNYYASPRFTVIAESLSRNKRYCSEFFNPR